MDFSALELAGANGLAVLVIASVIWSVGLAPVYILATDMIVTAAPPERAAAARGAFTQGMVLSAAIAAATMLCIALMVPTWLRDIRPSAARSH